MDYTRFCKPRHYNKPSTVLHVYHLTLFSSNIELLAQTKYFSFGNSKYYCFFENKQINFLNLISSISDLKLSLYFTIFCFNSSMLLFAFSLEQFKTKADNSNYHSLFPCLQLSPCPPAPHCHASPRWARHASDHSKGRDKLHKGQLCLLSYMATELGKGLGLNMGHWVWVLVVTWKVGLEKVEHFSIWSFKFLQIARSKKKPARL